MYRIQIYNKSKKLIATYDRIHTVKYVDVFGEPVTVSGVEMLTHNFPTFVNYQLLSNDGNYSIDRSIIGTFEVRNVIY